MTITLTAEQRAWIDSHVANGEFPSVEQATRSLLDQAISMHPHVDDDLGWAKPLIDEALAEIERGETISLEEHLRRNDARLGRQRRE